MVGTSQELGGLGVSTARERRWREPGHRDARKARGSGGQPRLRQKRSGGWGNNVSEQNGSESERTLVHVLVWWEMGRLRASRVTLRVSLACEPPHAAVHMRHMSGSARTSLDEQIDIKSGA